MQTFNEIFRYIITYKITKSIFHWFILILCSAAVQAQDENKVDELFTLSLEELADISISYIDDNINRSLKAGTSMHNLPFSSSTYTREFIKSIDATHVADLYSYMTGIQRSDFTGYDITFRGFTSGSPDPNSILIDGLPGLAARWESPLTVNAEQIEVIRGPASTLYGTQQPGGFVNIITKKPQFETASSIDARVDDFYSDSTAFEDAPGIRLSTDFTGPINNDIAYRLIFQAHDTTSFRDDVTGNGFYIAPSLLWQAGSSTTILTQFEFRHEELTLDNYAVAPNNNIALASPINVHLQEPDDEQKESGLTLGMAIDHQFDDHSAWHFGWRSVFFNDEREGFENRAILNTTTLSRRHRIQENERGYHFLDTYFTHDFGTGSLMHHLLYGFYGGRETSDFDRAQVATDPALDIDIFNPVYGAATLPLIPGSHRKFTFDNYSVYMMDRIELTPQWQLLAGLSYDRQDSEFEELRLTTTDESNSVNAILPSLGIVFQADKQWSLYGNYTTSFKPATPTTLDQNGNNIDDPATGEQVELGIKYKSPNEKTRATLALFHIKAEDTLNPLGGGLFAQTGEERSQGLELEVDTRPFPNLELTAGYAFMDAEVTEDNRTERVGTNLLNTPRHSAHMWSNYDFSSVPGLGLGLGLIYVGKRLGAFPTTTLPALELDSYLRADLGIYYKRKDFDATFKLNNLFDEEYFESSKVNTRVIPGEPAQVSLSLSWSF